MKKAFLSGLSKDHEEDVKPVHGQLRFVEREIKISSGLDTRKVRILQVYEWRQYTQAYYLSDDNESGDEGEEGWFDVPLAEEE